MANHEELAHWLEYVLNTPTDRRAFFRAFLVDAVGVVGGTLGIASYFETKLRDLAEEEQNLVSSLFGPGLADYWISIVPAAHHPFHPLAKGESWYPIEDEAAQTYCHRFFSQTKFRIVPDFPQVRDDDGIVLLGSQVSNVNTRQILGSPWQEKPTFDVLGGQWQTTLRWNLHTPQDAPVHRILQYGKEWNSKDHQFCCQSGDVFKSKYTSRQEDDYLLVTALPRYRTGKQTILIFAGLHGAGTRAASYVLTHPPVRELEEMRERIHGGPYYQALFHVSLAQNITGELRPREVSPADPSPVSLVDASPLNVTFL